jgi:hypothetical protein
MREGVLLKLNRSCPGLGTMLTVPTQKETFSGLCNQTLWLNYLSRGFATLVMENLRAKSISDLCVQTLSYRAEEHYIHPSIFEHVDAGEREPAQWATSNHVYCGGLTL